MSLGSAPNPAVALTEKKLGPRSLGALFWRNLAVGLYLSQVWGLIPNFQLALNSIWLASPLPHFLVFACIFWN